MVLLCDNLITTKIERFSIPTINISAMHRKMTDSLKLGQEEERPMPVWVPVSVTTLLEFRSWLQRQRVDQTLRLSEAFEVRVALRLKQQIIPKFSLRKKRSRMSDVQGREGTRVRVRPLFKFKFPRLFVHVDHIK